jgi:hypothetical protein
LIEKYGFNREEFFLTTRQGFINLDSIEKVPKDLIIEELKAKNSKIEDEIISDSYCSHPDYLELSLNQSL